MRLNKKRKDARFPQWLLEALDTLRVKYQWTFTEALIRCTEKGIVYYSKQWDKMHGKEKPAEGTGQGQRCPNESPKESVPPEEEVSDEEVNWALAGLPMKDPKTGIRRPPTEEERQKKFEKLQARDKKANT